MAMKKILSRRPSPAVIIAIVALIAALTGTAVAGGGFLTKKKFKNQAVRGPVQYVTNSVSVPNGAPGDYVTATATCPPGTKVVGGGIKLPDPNLNGAAYVDDAYVTTTGYTAHVTNNATSATTATVTANCVTVKSSTGTPPAS
jgi:hypothetical protein